MPNPSLTASPGFVRSHLPPRPAGMSTHDQARVTTPAAALDAGADILVIGRAVTDASDPVRAAADLVASLANGT